MKRFAFVIFFVSFVLSAWCQADDTIDKITLHSGEVFVGKIIIKNSELIMISTADGMRFQFAMSEVKKIETIRPKQQKIDSIQLNNKSTSHFNAIIDSYSGYSTAAGAFKWSAIQQMSIVFGNNVTNKNPAYLGAGIGYTVVFVKKNEVVSFLPLFFRCSQRFNGNHISPFIGFDAGYAFSLEPVSGGGEFFKLFLGLDHKIAHKTTFSVAIFGGVQGFKTKLVDNNTFGSFIYFGKTSIVSTGLKLALQF